MFIIHILSNGTEAAVLCCAPFKVVADYTMSMCQCVINVFRKTLPLFI